MVKHYTVLQAALVKELEIVNGQPVEGPLFHLQPGDVITVDTSRVVSAPNGGPAVAHHSIFLIDRVTIQGPIPSSSSVFSDEAIPVGVLEDDEDEPS